MDGTSTWVAATWVSGSERAESRLCWPRSVARASCRSSLGLGGLYCGVAPCLRFYLSRRQPMLPSGASLLSKACPGPLCPLPDLSAVYSPGLGRPGNREASGWEGAGRAGQEPGKGGRKKMPAAPQAPCPTASQNPLFCPFPSSAELSPQNLGVQISKSNDPPTGALPG